MRQFKWKKTLGLYLAFAVILTSIQIPVFAQPASDAEAQIAEVETTEAEVVVETESTAVEGTQKVSSLDGILYEKEVGDFEVILRGEEDALSEGCEVAVDKILKVDGEFAEVLVREELSDDYMIHKIGTYQITLKEDGQIIDLPKEVEVEITWNDELKEIYEGYHTKANLYTDAKAEVNTYKLKDDVYSGVICEKFKIAEMEENNAFLPDMNNEPVDMSILRNKDATGDFGKASNLPSKYGYDKIDEYPYLFDQGEHGTCWATSTMTMVQMNAMKKGYESSREFKYSPAQLVYFAYNYTSDLSDPLGGTKGDSNRNRDKETDTSTAEWDIGGNYFESSQMLSNWVGPVTLEDVPYETTMARNGVAPAFANCYSKDQYHLKNSNYVNFYNDRDAIKQMIYDNGCAGIFFGAYPAAYLASTNSYYIDRAVETRLSNAGYDTNHLIAIVGWDDNFSKDNFRGLGTGTTPGKNGAWLCRNSWMSSDASSSKSSMEAYTGYFWMSYENGLMHPAVFSMEVEPVDEYERNYQYDGTFMPALLRASTHQVAANVFTSQASASKTELLEAVSFVTSGTNISYQVDIYKNPTDSTNPESGTHVESATTNGMIACNGIHEVVLKEPVPLSRGDKFSVVVTLDGASVAFAVEADLDYFIQTRKSIERGKSFLQSDMQWYDLYDVSDTVGNVRIKAFTNTCSGSIAYDLKAGDASLPSDCPIWYYEKKATSLPTPSRTGYQFVGWYTSPNYEGTPITAIPKGASGNYVLYAKWDNGGVDFTKVNEEGLGVTAVLKKAGPYTYTGNEIHPAVKVTYTYLKNGKQKTATLKENADYILTYKNAKNVTMGTENKAVVTVKGIGDFTSEEHDVEFDISAMPMTKMKLTAPSSIDFSADEADIRSEIQLCQNESVVPQREYTLLYNNMSFEDFVSTTISSTSTAVKVNIKATPSEYGTNYQTGTYTKEAKVTLTIGADGRTDAASIQLNFPTPLSLQYTGKQQKPKPIVTMNGEKLSTKDYYLQYSNNLHVGTAAVVAYGKGKYYGKSAPLEFEITPADINKVKSPKIGSLAYSPFAKEASPALKFGKDVLTPGVDYTIEMAEITASTSLFGIQKKITHTFYVKGTGDFTGDKDLTFTFTPRKLSNPIAVKVECPAEVSIVSGKNAAIPVVSVYYGKQKLVEGVDYTMTLKNNTQRGKKATATISGIGNYTGKTSAKFTVK